MLVTTAGRTTEQLITRAKRVADELEILYRDRHDASINRMQQQYKEDVFVVGKDRYVIYPLNSSEPIFFHPNSAMFRIKRLMKGEHDPFIQSAGLKHGMTILDCTLGLGSDSITASYVVGKKGRVISLEGNCYLAYLVKNGLQSWDSGSDEINKAMRAIEVKHVQLENYLAKLEENSVDIVYFDPMFEEAVSSSDGIKGLRHYAIYSELTEQTLHEAKRAAKKRIVLKDHWKSTRFKQFGFDVHIRPTSKFHFGVIEL
ncbi:class I SAM-dependent methyltransferase [Bacillus taeanensis]|uniref:Protein-L-IsoD(D-D) O-methyltransferase n=1 Tax=Bacillus taeanensis TaxID=273032 RepID=A0A366XZ95_9BACI|nr:class I SAM-dependent methyltransferase [Bacillus taeanensis]RBW69484.1 protein-L-IsoD(D-D) O-methyltransferase [Bacillus taeanensis]